MCAANFKVLAYDATPLGMLCLRRRELLSCPGTIVTEVTLDHEYLMSSYLTDSERALATEGLALTPEKDLRVLVGGLGLGYTAAAVLASDRVGQVEVVEFLPQVINWLDEGLIPLADTLKNDSRLVVSQGDVYKRLTASADTTFDLILIDVDHSPDDKLEAANALFYTEQGLQNVRKHLAKGGVLGVWSYAESSPFVDALENVFGDVIVKQIPFMNPLVDDEEYIDWLFFAKDS